ncbi:MAG TPA: phage portal protein, partial [Nocardioides sp.]
MPTPTQTELKAQMERLLKQLDKQTKTSKKNRGYYTGDDCAIPEAVVKAKLRKAYRLLMPMSEAPWGSLIVDSVQDRLEVTGIRSGDDGVDAAIWSQGWQANQMDAESPLAHNAALVDGRVYATVWPGDDDQPEIVLDDATQMAVEYREGRHKVRHRVAALRRWKDDDETEHVTLYRPEGIYKFTEAKEQGRAAGRIKAGEKWWEKREIDGEPWPVPNPWGVLNVVEIAINRRLAPGRFLDARGEFANCLGLIDRINLLTFLGLVVAFWMGFPLRGVIG